MKPQPPGGENTLVVRRLYEARGNPETIRQVLAPDVRWEVVPGFPHSDIYHGLNGVSDFFTRLFGDFEEWHTEPSEIFETGDHVFAVRTGAPPLRSLQFDAIAGRACACVGQ